MPSKPTLALAAALALLTRANALTAEPDQQPAATTSQGAPDPSPQGPLADLGTRHTGEDWPKFMGNSGDGKSPEEGILRQWPAEGPPIVWHTRVGEGYSMPTISQGRLFEFSRYGGKARLTAMHSETGKPLWKFEYPTDYDDLYGYDNGPRTSPVVDADRVYIYGPEGMLHCLRAADGGLVWKRDTFEDFGVIQNFFGVGSTPVIEGDLLITVVGGSPESSRRAPPGALDLVRPNGTAVVAFDKLTGETRYQLGDDLAAYASPVLATIDGRRWCFVFARGGLLGFNPSNGQGDFHYPWRASLLESVNASNPVVVGNQVFISETYGPGSSLLAVKPGGYEVIWTDEKRRRDKSMQTHWNTPIHHEGYLYGSSGRHSENALLRCIELATGKVMWSQPGLTRSSLLYVDGHLVCLTEVGDLLLIKASPEKLDVVAQASPPAPEAGPLTSDGQPSRLLTFPAWAAPILSHGLLYVRGHHRLVCMELIPAS